MKAAPCAAAWLLLAAPWLQGCEQACPAIYIESIGNFRVTLSVAAPPLPDDLQIVLSGDEPTVVFTLTDVPSDSFTPSCWFGSLGDYAWPNEADAAAADADRISCAWGHGATGSLAATATGYHDVALTLHATPIECECPCSPWIPAKETLELQPL